MTPITPTGREERMKHEQQEIAQFATELAAAIELCDWSTVQHFCERLEELADGVRMDAYHVARSSPRSSPSSP